jgi:hypothetical protein
MLDTDVHLYTVREEGKSIGLSNRLTDYCRLFEKQNSEAIADIIQYDEYGQVYDYITVAE